MPVCLRKSSAFWATYRGSRVYASIVTGSFTLQVRTMVGTAENGSIWAVVGSGMSSMSDSSIVWNPRIDDPSKPIPSENRSSSRSCIGMEKCCQRPGTSMKRRSTIFAPRSLAAWMTSFGVFVSSGFTSSAMQSLR